MFASLFGLDFDREKVNSLIKKWKILLKLRNKKESMLFIY